MNRKTKKALTQAIEQYLEKNTTAQKEKNDSCGWCFMLHADEDDRFGEDTIEKIMRSENPQDAFEYWLDEYYTLEEAETKGKIEEEITKTLLADVTLCSRNNSDNELANPYELKEFVRKYVWNYVYCLGPAEHFFKQKVNENMTLGEFVSMTNKKRETFTQAIEKYLEKCTTVQKEEDGWSIMLHADDNDRIDEETVAKIMQSKKPTDAFNKWIDDYFSWSEGVAKSKIAEEITNALLSDVTLCSSNSPVNEMENPDILTEVVEEYVAVYIYCLVPAEHYLKQKINANTTLGELISY